MKAPADPFSRPAVNGEDVPILSVNAIYEVVGAAVQHALRARCGHSIPQADCFSCGMDHVFRGLFAVLPPRRDG